MNKTTQGHKIIKLLKASDKEKNSKSNKCCVDEWAVHYSQKKKREREKQREKKGIQINKSI